MSGIQTHNVSGDSVAVNLTEKIRTAVTGKFSHVSELGINIYTMVKVWWYKMYL